MGDGKFVFALIYLSKHERGNIQGSFHPDVRVRVALKRLQLAPHLDHQDGKPWFKAMMSATYPIKLEGREIPTLVAFKDINDPSTIIERKSQADFDAVFGEGYGFLSAKLEVAKEAKLLPKVFDVIPWAEGRLGYFTLFGKPCEICSDEGHYVENSSFGDFISYMNFVKVKK